MKRNGALALVALTCGIFSVLASMRTNYLQSVPRVVFRKSQDTILVYRDPAAGPERPRSNPLTAYLKPVVRDTERIAILPDSTGRSVDARGRPRKSLSRADVKELIVLSSALPTGR